MSSAARVLPSGHLLGRFCKCRPGSARGMQGAKPRSPQRHCRKHPRFSTPCGKDCGLFPAFSQPVENYVEKHGMHSRMQTPQTANPGIAAEKHAPRCPVDMHKKPDGQIPQANRKPRRMSTNAGGQKPRLSHRKQKKSVHNDRFVAVGTPPDTKKSHQNHPRTRISTIRQGKIRIFRTEPRRQKRQKVPAVAGYSGFPQFPAPYCSCFWMEG